LQKQRIDAYEQAWKMFESFADYSKYKKVTLMEAEKLLTELTSWYYGKGGLLMSRASQKKYLNVIRVTDQIITRKIDEYNRSPTQSIKRSSLASSISSAGTATAATPSTSLRTNTTAIVDSITLEYDDFKEIFKAASTFRTSLSRDVGSRIFIFHRELGDFDLDDGIDPSSADEKDPEQDRENRYNKREPIN
jgi:hypothetical protein